MTKAFVELTGETAELIISAPPLNLFDLQTVADVEAALAETGALVRDGRARAVILRADGDVFCAGVDVHEFQGLSTAEGASLMARMLTLTQSIEALPVPTVAVVHALNLTIGFELTLGCDLMWAADEASFGLVESTVGLTPGAGGTQRLAARAGVARAAEFVMTGDVYPAQSFTSGASSIDSDQPPLCCPKPGRSPVGSRVVPPSPSRWPSGCCRPPAITGWRPPMRSPRGRPALSSRPGTWSPGWDPFSRTDHARRRSKDVSVPRGH